MRTWMKSIAFTVGAALIIPMWGIGTAAASVSYTVLPGDSLWKIATKQGITVDSLMKANNLKTSTIYPGARLTIPSAPTNAKVAAVIQTAQSYLGVPYVWGGTSPAGFDCSGFVHYTLLQNGIVIPRTTDTQFHVGTFVPANQLQVGDLVFFGNTYRNGVSHVGIYLGNDQFIHASETAGKVIVSKLWENPYYAAHYWGAKRVIH